MTTGERTSRVENGPISDRGFVVLLLTLLLAVQIYNEPNHYPVSL